MRLASSMAFDKSSLFREAKSGGSGASPLSDTDTQHFTRRVCDDACKHDLLWRTA